MIYPPGLPGIAFTSAVDGDMRGSPDQRRAVAGHLGISADWAIADQVHGSTVLEVTSPGNHGPADGLFTAVAGVPVAVFTADCFGVAMIADGAVGVAHAGWRGVVAGVIGTLAEAMSAAGYPPQSAAAGPGIGPCCYEVGTEVAEHLAHHRGETTLGTQSVDLPGAIREQLGSLKLWQSESCTMCSPGFYSHRVDATTARMATIAWMV